MVESIRTVAAADGYALSYRVWSDPSRAAPRATLALFNGVVSHAGWFAPIAEPLASRGYDVVGADRRGSGRNEIGRGDAPSAAVVLDDAARILEHARAPDRPVVLVGWCWGAILAVHLAAMRRDLAGLVLLTPGLWPTAAIKSAMVEHAKAGQGAPPDAAVLKSPITDDMFTAGRALDEFIRRDPDRLVAFTPRFLAISTKLTMSASARLRELDLPMLCVLASRDRATDNAATRAALAQLRVPPRIVELPSDHGMQFDAPDPLVDTLDRWVRDVVPAAAA